MRLAKISDFRDLKPVLGEDGAYTLNFGPGGRKGGVKVSNSEIAPRWYCSYKFRLDENFSWGTTGHDGGDQFLSNIKVFRLWNPGTTQENLVIAIQGWADGLNFDIEHIEGKNGKRQSETYYGMRALFQKDVDHFMEFEFKENSALNASDGYFKMWVDGKIIFDKANLVTRSKHEGYKRPYIIGFNEVWGSGGDSKAPNDYKIWDIKPYKNGQRVQLPDLPGPGPIDPPIEPPIEPPVTPIPPVPPIGEDDYTLLIDSIDRATKAIGDIVKVLEKNSDGDSDSFKVKLRL